MVLTRLKMKATNATLPTEDFLATIQKSTDSIPLGRLSYAHEGNILESMNLAINIFDKHFIDRDLSRTGLSIVIVSASSGFFTADRKLLRLTQERMVEDGIGLDIVSLGKPPLHSVPLFRFQSSFPGKERRPSGVFSQATTPGTSNIHGPPAPSVPSALIGGGFSHSATATATATAAASIDPSFKANSSAGASTASRGSPISAPNPAAFYRESENWDPLFYDVEDPASNSQTWFFQIPHWIDMSYYFKCLSSPGFTVRCRMPDVQRGPLVTLSKKAPILPPLSLNSIVDETFMEIYDSAIFHDINNHPTTTSMHGGSTRMDSPESTANAALSASIPSVADPSDFSSPRTHMADSMTASPRRSVLSPPRRTPGGGGMGVESFVAKNMESASGSSLNNQAFSRSVPSGMRMTPLDATGSPASGVEDGMQIRRVQRGFPMEEESSFPSQSLISRKRANATDTASSTAGRMIGGTTGLRSGLSKAVYASPTHRASLASKPLVPSMMANSKAPAVHPAALSKLIDPCKPSHNNMIRSTSNHLRRWHHVFPKKLLRNMTEVMMKWTSLCSPACLPLTTDYFPTTEELSEFYQEYTYTVSLNDEMTPYGAEANVSMEETDRLRTQNLLLELISQRLAQGFQLVVGPAADLAKSTGLTSFLPPPSFPSDSMRGNGGGGGGGGSGSGGVGGGGGGGGGGTFGGDSMRTSLRSEIPASSALFSTSVTMSPRMTGSPFGNAAKGIDEGSIIRTITAPFYLTMGQQVHRLVYDPSAQNVEVKRYVRHLGYSTDPIHYVCAMWPKYLNGYIIRSATFSYPSSGNYNWNYLDHVVSGYQEELTESLRFWRTRFVLIPMEAIPQNVIAQLNPSNENLNDEEIRLAGFMKFLELFHKARWTPPEERNEPALKKNIHSGSNIPITFTTFQTSTFVMNEVTAWRNARTTAEKEHRKAASTAAMAMDGLTKDVKLSALASAMTHPIHGVQFKDRRWHLRFYEKVFIGSECVDWMIRVFMDIDTREEAVEFGNMLLTNGFFEHVNQKHRFLDGHYFYRLNKDYTTKEIIGGGGSSSSNNKEEKGPMRWFRTTTASKQHLDASASSGAAMINNGTVASEDSAVASFAVETASSIPIRPMRRIELSRKIVIDLDPQLKSYRSELAILHYDTVYNPKNCYHFQMHWLVCTARLVEDLLLSWTRVAEKVG